MDTNTAVQVREGVGPLGVLDPANRRHFLEDRVWGHGDSAGRVIATGETMPDGWLMVELDEPGSGLLVPVHPDMVEPVA